jgi:hypothetical protein
MTRRTAEIWRSLLRTVAVPAVTVFLTGQFTSAQVPCFVDRIEPTQGVIFGSFGREVAIHSHTAIVGAPGVGITVGSAHIFTFGGATWTELQMLEPSDPEPDFGFGRSVAIRSDVAIVGAKRSAYVFRLIGASWIEQQKLIAWDDPDETGLGNGGVALLDDRIVVGDWGNNENGNLAGAAYVFRHDGREWVPEQKLYPSDAQPNHQFGHGVAIQGDMIAIGAPWDGDQNTLGCEDIHPATCLAGAVYIFRFDSETEQWIETQKITPEPSDDPFIPLQFLKLGFDIAISGDAMIVGTDNATVSPSPCGHSKCGIAFAYTFDPETGLWGNKQMILPEQPGIRRFGRAVDIDGDSAIIGAFNSGVAGFGPGSPYEGAALLYERQPDGLWEPSAMFLPEPPWPHSFGWAVAISGNHTLVGAPLENGQQGAAYFHKIDALGDLDCDGVVDVFDLIELINQWGPCPDPEFLYTDWMSCPADLNGDSVVDGADLLILLANWG